MKKLRGVEAALANFFASGVLALGAKLGPVLWQLPPDARLRPRAARGLPRPAAAHHGRGRRARRAATTSAPDAALHDADADRPLRHAMEVRHPSFATPAFVELLRRHGVALVVADTAGTFPRLDDVTADLVYVRLHGDTELYASGYSPTRWTPGRRASAPGPPARHRPRRTGGPRRPGAAGRRPGRRRLLRQRRQGARAVRRDRAAGSLRRVITGHRRVPTGRVANQGAPMKAVAYIGPGKVEVQDIDYPTLELKDGPGVNPANVGRQVPARRDPQDRRDQHLRQRPAHGPRPHHRAGGADARPRDHRRGRRDRAATSSSSRSATWCSVPFNIACGRCRNCKEGKTGVCLNVNPDRPGSAYGYVDMGGWVGGQAEYVMVPYADWNLLKFPDKDQAMEKILDLTMLSDIFPTGYHGCVTRRASTTGSTVYVAGAGPVGLAAARVGAAARRGRGHRRRPERGAAGPGAQLRLRDGRRDRKGDAEGPDRADPRRAGGRLRRSTRSASRRAATARTRSEAPATVLNSLMEVTRAGGALGIPGLYVTGDPGAADEAAKVGSPVDPARPRLGQVALLHHRPVPGDALPPRADAGDPARPGADREGRQRHRDPARRGARRATPSSTGARRSTSSTPTGLIVYLADCASVPARGGAARRVRCRGPASAPQQPPSDSRGVARGHRAGGLCGPPAP